MSITFSGVSTGAAGGVQQAYSLTHTALVEGQFADIADNTVGTFINETGAVLPFGNVVVVNTAGTVGNSAKTIAATGDAILGVHGRTYIEETANDANSRLGASNTCRQRPHRGQSGCVCDWCCGLHIARSRAVHHSHRHHCWRTPRPLLSRLCERQDHASVQRSLGLQDHWCWPGHSGAERPQLLPLR